MTAKKVSRRRFVGSVPVATTTIAALGKTLSKSQGESGIKAQDVYDYLRSLDGGWVDWQNSVDTFKSGSPSSLVKGIGVGWMSYTWAIEKSLALGCNLFVTHEPTYYNHRDNDQDIFRFEVARNKKEFIEDSGITILRCHDVWDQVKSVGIPEAWGSALDLGEPIDGSGYYYVYDAKGATAESVSRHIAGRVRSMGQPGIQLIGPADKAVNRVVLGCGAITPLFHFIEELKADMAICSDDGFVYWRDGAFAIDAGFPVAVINHPVTEEPGARSLAELLKGQFPEIPVHHISEKCMYELVT